MSQLFGFVLIVVPILLYQASPETPLGRSWQPGQYFCVCLICGFVGGVLLGRRTDTRLGFLWAGGGMAGSLTSGLSYLASENILEIEETPSVNIFVIILCAFPGWVLFLLVKRCSDYTFPDQASPTVRSNPTDSRKSMSQRTPIEEPHFPQSSTPLLVAARI